MSSNGVMLQDYVPNAINNLTEEIWCAGAVIPAGKKVVIGHMRDGWLEVTFTMGKTQDFIGMAMVPPSVVGIDEPTRFPGVGFMPQGVAAMAVRQGRSQKQTYCPDRTWRVGLPRNSNESGWLRTWNDPSPPPASKIVDVCVPTCGPGEVLNLLAGQHTLIPESDPYFVSRLIEVVQMGLRPVFHCVPGESTAYAPSRGAIDQSAPLPPRGSQGATRMGPVWPVGMPTAAAQIRAGIRGMGSSGVGDVPEELPEGWPESGSPGTGIFPYYSPAATREIAVPSYAPARMMPGNVASRHAITSWGVRARGFGAAGASEFTVKAGEELDEHLTTNGCAGCDDYKSTLRQLAFKFKAACMTDPGVSGQVSFNISTPLAMTAFGTGTDKALTLVLGQKKTYSGGPCTDDNGVCLGNLPQIAQVTPVALGPLVTQVLNQIGDQIQQQQAQPNATQLGRQEPLVNALVGAATGLLVALSAALAKATPIVNITPTPPPAAPPATTPAKGIPWGTVIVGGLIGTTILATGAFVYTHARRA